MWRVLGTTVLALIVLGRVAAAETPTEFYVAVDKARLLDVGDPVTKVSITTPAIADVSVLSPTALLVNGKSAGVTSLVVVGRSGQVRDYDVIVYPAPLVDAKPPVADADVRAVLVQRGDSFTNQLFMRDRDELWQELGTIKSTAAKTK